MSTVKIGYTLSSEEQAPQDLVKNARQAEELGFDFLSISDHFFPWIDNQGQSPFVWSILGAISQVTTSIPIMTGVTCPIMRIHPVILAQAAATTAALFEDRFWFGIGTGENLNEHVVGQGWPNINQRQRMLVEAIDIIRQLWTGQLVDRQGDYFRVDQAKIYTLPQHLPPIYLAASGSTAAELAGGMADGLIATSADKQLVDTFNQAGGQTKPKCAQLTVCYHPDKGIAEQTALKAWPNSAIVGQASQELPMPAHFDQLASAVTQQQIAQAIVCGPDPQDYIKQVQEYRQAGFTHLYIHQVGTDQQPFFDFYSQQVMPHVREGGLEWPTNMDPGPAKR